MSWAGNTIARSLALVAIATGAAFGHWGRSPLTLSLRDPRGSVPDGPAGADVSPAPPSDTGPDAGSSAGADTPDDPAVEPDPGGEGAADTAFDPSALGPEIGTADAFALWSSGAVTFIDARPAKDYEAGHIPFAYLVPAESVGEGRLGEMIEAGGLDFSSRLVVYCEGGSCDASHLVALTLQDMGFEKIHIYLDGFPAWEQAGYEIQTGPDEMLGDVP